MNIWYIIIAILMFGFMILTHELGHYTFARIFHVKIFEFSIGMGPKLLSRVSRKTDIRYSLRLFPIGGYVSMAGEDEDSTEANALCNKPVWQRMVITAAGGLTNVIIGILATIILVSCTKSLGSTVIHSFESDTAATKVAGLCVNDEILRIDGVRVHIGAEVSYQIMHRGNKPVDVTVRRNGEVVVVEDVPFPTFTENGHTYGETDFYILAEEKTVGNVLKQSLFQSLNTVRVIWESLIDLATGSYGVQDLSGPVGVTQVISEAAQQSVGTLFYMFVFISMNLGIFNLLPLPALDGGRLLFMLIELIFRKPVPRRIEGYIHAGGLILLLLLMVFITGKDIFNLIRK